MFLCQKPRIENKFKDIKYIIVLTALLVYFLNTSAMDNIQMTTLGTLTLKNSIMKRSTHQNSIFLSLNSVAGIDLN
jgi:hypothetical protein